MQHRIGAADRDAGTNHMTSRKLKADNVNRPLVVAFLVASLAACHESDTVDRTVGQTAQAVKKTGEGASPAGRRETHPVDDALITTRVKTALFRDPQASGFQISVHAYRGVVQLSGFVDTVDQKQRAGELAGRIEGVQAVHNDLIVTSGTDFTSSDSRDRTSSPNFDVVQSGQGGKP